MEYLLNSVRKDGKGHSHCTLEIDEAKRYVQIKARRGLGRGLFQVVDFYYDASTVVEVDGERLRVGELEMVAKSRGDAQEIAGSIRKPAVEVVKQADDALKEIEVVVQGFLEAREEAVSTLMKLRKDPRTTLLEASAAWESLTGDPVEQLYTTSQQKISSSRDQMEGLIEALEWKVGKKVVERLYALCYAVGKLQDALFSGSAEEAEAAKRFLVELGIKAGDLREVTLEGSSKRIMKLAHEVLVALIELPKQLPERSELLGPPKKS